MADLKYVGRPTVRVDAIPRVTGQALYTDDIPLPARTTHAVLVKSPHPHARIVGIDTSKAEAVPGVIAVLDYRHPGMQYRWVRGDSRYKRMLFSKTVRYAGDIVAMVIAEDRYIAEDAARLVEVKYEVLPHVLDLEEAAKPGAPILHADEGAKNNLQTGEPNIYKRGDVEKGFAQADFILEDRFETQWVHDNQLEPRVTLAMWEGDKLTLWTPTQGITNSRINTAQDLGIPESNIRVVNYYMGGGFGQKNGNQNIDTMVAAASKVVGRPVKLWMSRRGDMTELHGRWPSKQYYKIGFKKDGTVTAAYLKGYTGLGAWAKSGGGLYGARDQLDCDNVLHELYPVYINTQSTGNMRAPSDPHGSFAIGQLIDMMAEKLGIDGKDIPEFNLKVATKKADQVTPYTSYGLPDCIRKGAEVIGWKDNWHKPGTKQLPDGRYHGMGMSAARRGAGFGMGSATVKVNADGTAHLIVGVVDIGTSAKTTMALFLAEALDIDPSKIKVTSGDTDVTGYASGESGSRQTGSGGPAVLEAGAEAKNQLMELALEILNAAEDKAKSGIKYTVQDLDAKNEVIFVKKDPEKKVTYAQAASRAGDAVVVSAFTRGEVPAGLSRTSFIAAFSEVAVDKETGQIDMLRYVSVHDSGQIVNPAAAEGQVVGSAIMGIGSALYEELIWDKATGLHVNANYHEVRIPSHLDIGKIEAYFVGKPDPYGPLGAKSLGEPAIVPAYAAIANAVYNAIGVRIKKVPMNPHTVLAAIKAARG